MHFLVHNSSWVFAYMSHGPSELALFVCVLIYFCVISLIGLLLMMGFVRNFYFSSNFFFIVVIGFLINLLLVCLFMLNLVQISCTMFLWLLLNRASFELLCNLNLHLGTLDVL